MRRSPNSGTPTMLLPISLKMYLSYTETLDWAWSVREMWAGLDADIHDRVTLAVLPSFPAIADMRRILNGSGIHWGAQDLAWADSGPYTGEVSPADLAQLDCTFAETGHAERRTLFHETDDTVLRKNIAAFRNGLTPIVCVGEPNRGPASAALAECQQQLIHTLPHHTEATGSAVIAYEPKWAIGAAEPAPLEHIAHVYQGLSEWLPAAFPQLSTKVIYGGSAGPGLLSALDGNADGLFLGRFAHDVSALQTIICEAAKLG
ncbi:triose-phosphate isomerase family protein [Lysinibacter cavernae]|uniref:Triosephosphate isomerase n=1 Tax=Lysinibacter cavernae TaxID=1640652 RepID=A0A7X5R1Z6_9MICO|nr:triose-phosphate isomerase family protein [Lysinibacter cavernae]NIH53957.1 triosephosphate isomerase [Lysinibacter cavernae]